MRALRKALPIADGWGVLAVGAVVASVALAACTNSGSSQGASSRRGAAAPMPLVPSVGQPLSNPEIGGAGPTAPVSVAAADVLPSPVLAVGRPARVNSAAVPPKATAEPGVPRNATTEYCPFTFGDDPAGPDPDYVTFLGPAQIPAGTA